MKAVLITGGAKRIGRALCEFFAQNQWHVIIHYNSSKKEADTLKDTLLKKGYSASIISGNLSNETETEMIIENSNFKGNIQCLVNNASEFYDDRLSNSSRKSWHDHIEVNLRAPFVLSKKFVEQLPNKVQGNIINITDQKVTNLDPTFISYTMSKAGLWTLTQLLAIELAPNIRVNAIGLGPVLKNIHQSQDHFDKQFTSVPLKAGPLLNEICETTFHILKTKSMTGQLLLLDGGQHFQNKTNI